MTAPERAAPPHLAEPDDAEPAIAPGRSLIRVGAERGASLTERVVARFQRLTWGTPLHTMRLRGRHPLKLLGVPRDPVAGDAKAGARLLDGEIVYGRVIADLPTVDFSGTAHGRGFADHLQSFAWLRDLAAAATREEAAPVAEAVMRRWLERHGEPADAAGWRADLWGRRILHWLAHAPLILSSPDLVYRSAVLNALARGARHLDASADKAPVGPARVAAWAGVIAAGLMIPGGDPRVARGEAGMARTLMQSVTPDGGIVTRSPIDLLLLIELLSMLQAVYDERGREPPQPVVAALARAVPALLGVAMGDGALSSWQGGGSLPPERVARVIAASGIRARPQRQSREWGFQRLAAGQAVVVVDCAPPPASRLADGGCASTLAFELADGARRIIVNCGGDQPWGTLARATEQALRTTAAHSTLTLADSNSTAIHPDGSLGKGVTLVELDRREQESASRIEASHDGYVRRFALVHQRRLSLSADGRALDGEDVLLPAGGGRGQTARFAVRFHLAPRVEATATADGLAALLRLEGGTLWQFRCRGATLAIEDSVWVGPGGGLQRTQQLVASGETPAGGTSLSWVIKRAG